MPAMTNPVRELSKFGQSVWLDYISRDFISSGQLQRMIDEGDLRGMTSNPAIFEKAISGSDQYAADIDSGKRAKKEVFAIYEGLSQHDVQAAADVFRPLYDRLNGADGYVSLEVNPHFAHDTEETIEEGRHLWQAVNRPNVFIKVPATKAGLPAITQLISEGINVNVTLLFGLPRYREVFEAYLQGLEVRSASGQPIDNVASVASFFLSRIDSVVDPELEKIMAAGGPLADLAKQAHGHVAISSAKIAYEISKEIIAGSSFRRLESKGAKIQRLLWASTGTKNPTYSDVKYVEALIGPNTVNTLPMETLEAFRDHGDPAPRLETDLEQARSVLDSLAKLGIDIDQVTQQLEDDGVEKFNKPFDKLMEALGKKVAGN